jgi:hypothetical protein
MTFAVFCPKGLLVTACSPAQAHVFTPASAVSNRRIRLAKLTKRRFVVLRRGMVVDLA